MDQAGIAEDLMGFVPVPPSGARRVDPRGRLTFLPGPNPLFANVSAVRLSEDDLDAFVAEARQWFAARGRADFTWFLGPSTSPPNLGELLEHRGATALGQGTGTAMVLDVAPVSHPGSSDTIDVRRVETLEQLAEFRRLLFFHGEEPADDQLAIVTAGLNAAWADLTAMTGKRHYFLAYIDGLPAAAGGLAITEQPVGILSGGSTARGSRGRGCYAALVRARWEVAQAAGSPCLVVHASDLSRPILDTLGFRPVADIRAWRRDI